VRAYFDWRAPRSAQIRNSLDAAISILTETASTPLDATIAARVFAALGIPIAAERVLPIDAAEIDVSFPESLVFPVVAKILSPDIAHKTEIGGVVLDIGSAHELERACRRIVEQAARLRPDARLVGIQVQPMLNGLAEALLGYRRDPAVGPVVTLGVGGVLAEIYGDVAIRTAPIDDATAHDMIAEVRGFAPVRGYRGLPRGDLDALARAVAAFSGLAFLDVAEAEINPLLIRAEGQGVVALDALLVRDSRHAD
jgi:hypothetical protein